MLESLEALVRPQNRSDPHRGRRLAQPVLNQFVADSTGRKVIAGPGEATAIGNILVQAMAAGEIRDLAEAREVVRNSFPLRVIEPRAQSDWAAAYERYRRWRRDSGNSSAPGEGAGRDHHPNCFSMWLTGGGIKSGQVIGNTDELGINGVEERVHIHDLHATMLHCLGMDHKEVTCRHRAGISGSPM